MPFHRASLIVLGASLLLPACDDDTRRRTRRTTEEAKREISEMLDGANARLERLDKRIDRVEDALADRVAEDTTQARHEARAKTDEELGTIKKERDDLRRSFEGISNRFGEDRERAERKLGSALDDLERRLEALERDLRDEDTDAEGRHGEAAPGSQWGEPKP
jgi:archaellum component FlaC